MFDRNFQPSYGQLIDIIPGVQRLTANNPSPYTFHGTNTYVVGSKHVAIIDPGPQDDTHLSHLLGLIGKRTVTHILVTHTHRDHSALAQQLSRITGAPIYGYSSGQVLRPQTDRKGDTVDDGEDKLFRPDVLLNDDDQIEGDTWCLQTLHTPGHASNHCSFTLKDADVTFSGDHVMAWSTCVIAPPDGSMLDYIRSLERLAQRNDRMLLPGHGGPVVDPARYLEHLMLHRQRRAESILDRLAQGDRLIPEIVAELYRRIDPRLNTAAALTVLAHLEYWTSLGAVVSDEPPSLTSEFSLVESKGRPD